MDDNDQKQKSDGDRQTQAGIAGTPGVSKEQEPGGNAAAELKLKEAPSEHREVAQDKEAGEFVKPTAAAPKAPADAKKAATQPTAQAAPVRKKQSQTVSLPLSDEEIVQGLHVHIWRSLHWLAAWCVRKLKKAHIMVKEVHGKLVKVKS